MSVAFVSPFIFMLPRPHLFLETYPFLCLLQFKSRFPLFVSVSSYFGSRNLSSFGSPRFFLPSLQVSPLFRRCLAIFASFRTVSFAFLFGSCFYFVFILPLLLVTRDGHCFESWAGCLMVLFVLLLFFILFLCSKMLSLCPLWVLDGLFHSRSFSWALSSLRCFAK